MDLQLAKIRAKYKALRLGKVGVKGRWVTMPANGPGGGGSPVYIDGEGEIQKGPKGTVGKKPSELPKDKPAAEQRPKPIKVPTVAPSPFKTDDEGFEQISEGFEESFQDDDIPVAKPIPQSPTPLDLDDDDEIPKIDIASVFDLDNEGEDLDPAPEDEVPAADDKYKGPDEFEDTPGAPIEDVPAVPGFLDKSGREAIAKLDDTQKLAVRKYSASSYGKLNGEMRKCPPDFDCLSESAKNFLDVLESAIEAAPPLPKPVTVFRGINVPETRDEILGQLQKIQESGGTYTMPSVTSTSVDPGLVNNFAGGDNGIIFRIKAKTGLYAASISKFPSEGELLQSSKTKYNVIGIADAKLGYGATKKSKVVYLEEQ